MHNRGSVRGWRAIYEKTIENAGFSMSPTRLGEAESNALFFRANSATFNAPSTDTVLGRDPGMRRNVPTAPLLAPQPKVRERTLGRRRAACLKNKICILYINICGVFHFTYSARRGGSNPLFCRANLATWNAPSTATVLGRDPDMRRNVPTAPLLAPAAKSAR